MPKSDSFTSPFHDSRMLGGLTSRWTIASARLSSSRRSWMYASACAISAVTCSAMPSGIGTMSGVELDTARSASRPSTYSIAMNSLPSIRP